VNVVDEGGPRSERFKISPRIFPRIRRGGTMESRGCSVSVTDEREIWERGLHCAGLNKKVNKPPGSCGIRATTTPCRSQFGV
jgi:hypothetical protein